jgi:hypothetical protein
MTTRNLVLFSLSSLFLSLSLFCLLNNVLGAFPRHPTAMRDRTLSLLFACCLR